MKECLVNEMEECKIRRVYPDLEVDERGRDDLLKEIERVKK